MSKRVSCLLAVSIAVLPLAAFGQAANAGNLLSKMEDFSIYPLLPVSKSSRTYAVGGYGFEFSFKVGEWKRGMTDKERAERCAGRKIDQPSAKCDPKATADTSLTAAQIRSSNGSKDTTFTVAIRGLEVTSARFEIAIGSQSTDLRTNTLVSGWQLTGRVQEFPSFALYASFRPDWPISPYLGLTFTQSDLKNVKLAQGDSAATIESSANGFALAAGAGKEVRGFNVFGELSYTALRFSTQAWKRPANFPAGASLPDQLELTGLRFSFGVQLPLGLKK